MVFKGCEILVEDVILKENLIPLEMHDFDVILDMDWLSTHRSSMDCFTKKVVFWKLGYLELEFEGDRRVLPTCVILSLEANRLLHIGCETYLGHVVDKSPNSPKVQTTLQKKEERGHFFGQEPKVEPRSFQDL